MNIENKSDASLAVTVLETVDLLCGFGRDGGKHLCL